MNQGAKNAVRSNFSSKPSICHLPSSENRINFITRNSKATSLVVAFELKGNP